MPLLVDTGILYALADKDDAWHARTRKYIEAVRDQLLAPATILPEVSYLLRDRIGARAERAFVRSLVNGELAVENLNRQDWVRAADLLSGYEDIGLVDATVVAVAERLKLTAIATTDRRHFSKIRPHHVDYFTLVP
jgi:predicted nucleic acid-binding protein